MTSGRDTRDEVEDESHLEQGADDKKELRPTVSFSADHNADKSRSDASVSATQSRRTSQWSSAPGEAQDKRKKQLNSLLNATAFPLFTAILVTVIKDGDAYTFYTTLMSLLLIGLALQIGIAIAIVVRNGMVHIENPLDIEAGIAKKIRLEKLKARFDLGLQIATTVSLALNLTIHAFFSARVLEDAGTSLTTK